MAAQKLPLGRKTASATGTDAIDVEFVAQQECVVEAIINKPANAVATVSKVCAGGATETFYSFANAEAVAATSLGIRGLKMKAGDELHIDVDATSGPKAVTAEAF